MCVSLCALLALSLLTITRSEVCERGPMSVVLVSLQLSESSDGCLQAGLYSVPSLSLLTSLGPPACPPITGGRRWAGPPITAQTPLRGPLPWEKHTSVERPQS